MDKIYFEDWQVGDRTISPSRTINEADLVIFADLTGDRNPLHIDVEYAKATIFGERIAHGMLVLAVAHGLFVLTIMHGMHVRERDSRALSNSGYTLCGIEKVRFVAPTKIGDVVYTESEVLKMTAIDKDRGLVTLRHCLKNHRGQDVLIYTSKNLFKRRPVLPESCDG
jgi:acyl dehydratase